MMSWLYAFIKWRRVLFSGSKVITFFFFFFCSKGERCFKIWVLWATSMVMQEIQLSRHYCICKCDRFLLLLFLLLLHIITLLLHIFFLRWMHSCCFDSLLKRKKAQTTFPWRTSHYLSTPQFPLFASHLLIFPFVFDYLSAVFFFFFFRLTSAWLSFLLNKSLSCMLLFLHSLYFPCLLPLSSSCLPLSPASVSRG